MILKETLLKSMKTAISNVMETMFFQPVKINDGHQIMKDWFPGNKSLLGAKLDFTGPLSGKCYILIPEPDVKEMTADFLGIDKEVVNKNQIRDTVKETLNMIGGNMLSKYNKSSAFHLSIPELVDNGDIVNETFSGAKGDILLIETDGKRLAMGLIVN